MRLVPHVTGADPWIIDPEFDLGSTLEEAFTEAATQTASEAGSDLLAEDTEDERNALRDRMIREMGLYLREVGDRYWAPDGVKYTLEED